MSTKLVVHKDSVKYEKCFMCVNISSIDIIGMVKLVICLCFNDPE